MNEPSLFSRQVGRRDQRGIVLVVVLWVVMLLAVIAGSFSFSARSSVAVADNLVSLARVRALADAGIQRGLYELAKPEADADRWKAVGDAHVFSLDEVEIAVSLRDEAGKIDLNTANEVLLKGLFASIGLADEEVAQLLDAIIDWRDADDLPRPSGAELDRYQAEGLPYAPANAAFDSVETLRLVIGMTPEIYRMVEKALTVYSRQGGINSTVADREVLRALPNVDEEDIEAYLQQRESMLANGQRPTPFPQASGFEFAGSSGVYNLRARAVALNGLHFEREATARLIADKRQPFLILRWSEAQNTTSWQKDGVDVPPIP